jgi:fructose-1,6-bisphosphatase
MGIDHTRLVYEANPLSFLMEHAHSATPILYVHAQATSTPVHANVHPLASAHSEVAQNATVGS